MEIDHIPQDLFQVSFVDSSDSDFPDSRHAGSPYTPWQPDHQCACHLSAVPSATGEGREFVGDVCCSWGVAGASRDELMLIASELLTNAIVHSGSTEVWLTMQLTSRIVWLIVVDTGHWKGRSESSGEMPESGRGLDLVRALASRCGNTHTSDGTRAWVEFVVPTSDFTS